MKTLTISCVVSLLFGLPLGQFTPAQQNTPLSSSTRVEPLGPDGGETVEVAMVVEYRVPEAEEPFDLLKGFTESTQGMELEKSAANTSELWATLAAMPQEPALTGYADWLSGQIDEMEVVAEAEVAVEETSVVFRPVPPPVATAAQTAEVIPLYEPWLARMKDCPYPLRAADYLPMIREAFAAEGLPEALVWLAEAESTFNPRARNPVGALGLFQLMPETARSLGLSLRPRDQRLHPATNARAAARYLKRLHARFGDWPLALAAYNGGEARVARLLRVRGATDFAGIASQLPAETRLYVPKVLATIEVRTGVSLAELGAPES